MLDPAVIQTKNRNDEARRKWRSHGLTGEEAEQGGTMGMATKKRICEGREEQQNKHWIYFTVIKKKIRRGRNEFMFTGDSDRVLLCYKDFIGILKIRTVEQPRN